MKWKRAPFGKLLVPFVPCVPFATHSETDAAHQRKITGRGSAKGGRASCPPPRTRAGRPRSFAFRALLQRLAAILAVGILLIGAMPASAEPARPMVAGDLAVLRGGIAQAPSRAPDAVKNAIWAVNSIQKKPYAWGGGHGTFFDRGYDCSGTISFLLHFAGLLDQPTPSNALMGFGDRGPGRWITLYVRRGHVFAVVAGLRLDTSGFSQEEGPRWRPDYRNPSGFEARHPKGL